VPVVVSALAIGAAGLGPTALLGLGWRRATAPGVIAAIVVGTGVTLVYIAGTQLFPSSFYAAWPAFSNAGEGAIEEFQALDEDANRAESAEARAAAASARDALARGSKGHPGLANWAGVGSASSAVFGAPLGLIVLMIVSLVTPRRRIGELERP
jgi:cation/acetate symporter